MRHASLLSRIFMEADVILWWRWCWWCGVFCLYLYELLSAMRHVKERNTGRPLAPQMPWLAFCRGMIGWPACLPSLHVFWFSVGSFEPQHVACFGTCHRLWYDYSGTGGRETHFPVSTRSKGISSVENHRHDWNECRRRRDTLEDAAAAACFGLNLVLTLCDLLCCW